MELAFSTNKFQYLHKIFHEIKHQEETAEAIVPDSCPDAAAIADCFACVYLRNKESRSGGAVVSGAVKAGALYTPEDGTFPRLLEFYMPFTVKFDSPELTDTAQLLSTLKVCSVDARMVNSRKIVMRVNVGCEITAYQQASDQTYALPEMDNRLQCRKSDLTLRLPVEIGEKYLVINDTLEIPGDRPPVVQICKICCVPALTDQKLIGDKAVFKGNLCCKALYRSENDRLYLWKQKIPFSQYCELQREYDEDELMVTPVVTSCDAMAEAGAASGRIQLTVNLLAQCIIFSELSMPLIEDAYCVRGELKPAWAQYALEGRLDRAAGTLSSHQSLQGPVQDVIDAEVYTDYPIWKRSDMRVEASIPVLVRVCAYDPEGTVVSLTGRSEMKNEYPLSGNALCMMDIQPEEDANIHSNGSGVEFRCDFASDAVFTAVQNLTTLCGGTIEERSGSENRGPSVILKTTEKGCPLWDIGKKYGTSVSSLQMANQLDSDITKGGMLLIPID